MKKFDWRLLAGGGLILIGIMTLLETLNIFPFVDIIWGLVFALGGAGFLLFLVNNRHHWWAVIPGVILLSLGVLLLIETLLPAAAGDIGGAIFLGGASIAFWLVYGMDTKRWWAIIPGGVMASLTLTVLVDAFTRFDAGVLFLFGLAVTFALLPLLPGLPGNRNWPWIPAGILFVIAVLALFSTLNWTSFFWAVLLIGAGLFLIVRNLLPRRS